MVATVDPWQGLKRAIRSNLWSQRLVVTSLLAGVEKGNPFQLVVTTTKGRGLNVKRAHVKLGEKGNPFQPKVKRAIRSNLRIALFTQFDVKTGAFFDPKIESYGDVTLDFRAGVCPPP